MKVNSHTGDNLAPPPPLFRFDMLMELVSAIISFLIGYYALKGYKASSERRLLFLHFGFVVLGVSMLLRAITTAYVIAILREGEGPMRPVLGFASIVYPLIKLIAYTLFAITYTYETRATNDLRTVSLQVGAFLLFYNPFLELLGIVLISYVMARSMINCAIKRSSDAMLVSLGFSSMFISHLFFLFATEDTLGLFILGHFVNLLGFLFFLVMLMQVSKTE